MHLPSVQGTTYYHRWEQHDNAKDDQGTHKQRRRQQITQPAHHTTQAPEEAT